MATRPSFLNLDEAQSTINDLENSIQQNISNLESNTVQQTRQAIDTIKNEITNLQSAIKNQDILKPLSDRLIETVRLFEQLESKGKQAILSQKTEIQSFMDKIVQMDDALRQTSKSLELLDGKKIGDISSVDEYIQKINSLKLSFDNMISTSDIINLEQADLDEIKNKITNFLNHLAKDGMQAFNLANMMMQSANDPAIESAFKEMLSPLNRLIAEIPQNVVDSFNKSAQQINVPDLGVQNNQSGASNVSLEQLTDALNNLTGKIKSADPGNGHTMYNKDIADSERSHQDNLNVEAAHAREVERLWEHVSRLGVSNEHAQNVDKNLEQSKKDITSTDKLIEQIIESVKSGKYSDEEKNVMNSVGITDETLLKMRDNVLGTEKLYNNYSVQNNGLKKTVNNYESSLKAYASDSSAENLEKLLKAEESVEKQARSAASALNDLYNYYNEFIADFNLTPDAFESLPKEMQDLFLSMQNIFTSNNTTANELLNLYKAFNLELDKTAETLKNTMENAKENVPSIASNTEGNSGGNPLGDILDSGNGNSSSLWSKAGKVFGAFKTGLSGFFGGVEAVNKQFDTFGLGAGVPTTLKDFQKHISNSVEWYKKFGIQDYEGALSQISQGGEINQSLLDKNQQYGIDLQKRTYGRVQYNEYTDMVNSLTSTVQGHYGEGDNKAVGQEDMSKLAGTGLMLQKIYGVDSTNAVGTFYKELNMGTTEVLDLLSKLTANAQAANIPVSQYVKTISDLGLQFKGLGVDLKLVENGMRNLTLNGMSMTNATSLVSQSGNVVDKFTDNYGKLGYYGVMSGQYSDPYEAMRDMSDRWDENGNVKEGSTDKILAAIGANMDIVGKISGGNENMQWITMFEELQNLGFGKQQAGQLMSVYENGDYTQFKQVFDKMFAELDTDEKQTIKLENQESLEKKLIEATNQLSEITKAEQLVISSEQHLAQVNERLYDSIGKGWQKMIDSIDSVAVAISEKALNNGITDFLGENTGWMMILAGVINSALQLGLSKALGNLGKNTFKKFTSSSKGGSSGNKTSSGSSNKSSSSSSSSKGSEAINDIAKNSSKNSGVDDAVKEVIKNGEKATEEFVEGVAKNSDEAIKGVTKNSSELIEAVGKNGDEVIKGVTKNSSNLIESVGKNSDEVIEAVGKNGDDVLKVFGLSASKALKGVAILGTALEAYFEFKDNKEKGKDTVENVLDTSAVVAGSTAGGTLGGWGGAAAGAAIGSVVPIVGTAAGAVIGGIIGGVGGGWLGGKAADMAVDKWDENKEQKAQLERQEALIKFNSMLLELNNEDTFRPNIVAFNDPLANDPLYKSETYSKFNTAVESAKNTSLQMTEKQEKTNLLIDSMSNKSLKEKVESNSNLKLINSTIETSMSSLEKTIKDTAPKTTTTTTSTTNVGPVKLPTSSGSSSSSSSSTSNLTSKDFFDAYNNSIFGTKNNTSIIDTNKKLTLQDFMDAYNKSIFGDIKVNSSSGSSSSNNKNKTSAATGNPFLDSYRSNLLGFDVNNNIAPSSYTSSSSPPTVSTRSGTLGGVSNVVHKDLTQKTAMTAAEIDAWINSNTSSDSKMRGMGSAFLKASEESGLDPLYLVAHAALETGWGSSTILKDKNNWFGIGAFDSSPYESAFGFSNLEAGIIEGANWISKNYAQDGQETLWKMVNDPEGWHNYATDPEWANKIARIMLEGVGGDESAIGALGSNGHNYVDSGSNSNSGSNSISTSVSFDDLKDNKYDLYKFSSRILDMGSPEYSNNAQSFDASKYQEYDNDFIYYDSQAMARKYYLDYIGENSDSSSITAAKDDKKTAYNQNPEFNININVSNGESVNYNAMAEEMRVALSNITEQYMGASARITASTYERANSGY